MGLLQRRETRADGLARCRIFDHMGLAPVADDHGDAGHHEHARGFDLGDHAARAHRGTGSAGNRQDLRPNAFHMGNELGVGVRVRITVVKAIDIREDDHEVGIDQARGQRGERVVVAELDLLDGNGVVLVDDGHHAQLQQAQKRVAGMQIRMAICRIAAGEQHRGGDDAVGREHLGIRRGQSRLPNRRRRLQARHVAGALLDTQGLKAARDGGRRHDDGLPAGRPHLRDLVGKRRQVLVIDAALRRGERRRTDLYDQAPCGARLGIQLLH